MQGWTGDSFYTSYQRTGYSRSPRADGLNAQTLTFTINWHDTSAMRKALKAKLPGIHLEAEIIKTFQEN